MPTNHSRAASKRGRTRSRISSATPTQSYLPADLDAVLYPEGPITEDNVELLHEFAHPHHRQRTTSSIRDVGEGPVDLETPSDGEEDIEGEMEEILRRPWYRRPSPWW